ncbi:hypothetical protein [Oceanobacillus kimchii]|uniref:hypothetical protein n=1 Tax=Oceanobacillus kimchii TaxID=746691 RepID=UPI00232B1042|nr:hypothetical protein [Oceanobacillus kimchii]
MKIHIFRISVVVLFSIFLFGCAEKEPETAREVVEEVIRSYYEGPDKELVKIFESEEFQEAYNSPDWEYEYEYPKTDEIVEYMDNDIREYYADDYLDDLPYDVKRNYNVNYLQYSFYAYLKGLELEVVDIEFKEHNETDTYVEGEFEIKFAEGKTTTGFFNISLNDDLKIDDQGMSSELIFVIEEEYGM